MPPDGVAASLLATCQFHTLMRIFDMTLEEMLRELIAERETDPQAASWQDAAQLLLLLATDEGAALPPLLVKLALRRATAELDASAPSAQDIETVCCQLTEHGKACIRRGELLRELSRIMQAPPQEAG
jgi:hypothetical protein